MLASYIFEQRTIDPAADGNWRFAPIAGDVDLTLSQAPALARPVRAPDRSWRAGSRVQRARELQLGAAPWVCV